MARMDVMLCALRPTGAVPVGCLSTYAYKVRSQGRAMAPVPLFTKLAKSLDLHSSNVSSSKGAAQIKAGLGLVCPGFCRQTWMEDQGRVSVVGEAINQDGTEPL